MVKAALILANDERGLQPVFGLPAVRRLVLLARRTGIGTVHIVSRQESIFAVVADLLPGETFHVAQHLEELDAVVRKIDICQGERMLVARGDHVVDPRTLATFLRAAEGEGIYSLSADGMDRTEAIYTAGGASLPSLVRALWSPGESNLNIMDQAERFIGDSGLPSVVGRHDEPVSMIEDRLSAVLPSATVDRDGFMARHFDRHISRLISRRLARTSVTPNGITLFNVAIGFTGAMLLSRGGYWSQVAGTLLFLLCVVLDGVDGEVARLKLQETTFGHYLDIVTDNLVHLAIFLGLGVGLYHQTGDGVYLHLLWFLLGGFGLCAAAVYRVSSAGPDAARSKTVDFRGQTSGNPPSEHGEPGTRSREVAGGWREAGYPLAGGALPGEGATRAPLLVDRLTGLLANRDFAYLLVVLAIIGRLEWFLIGAAVGSYLFAAIVFGLDLWRRRSKDLTKYPDGRVNILH